MGASLLDFMAGSYPAQPGYKRRETAIAAARDMRPRQKTLQQRILDALLIGGPMTPDEWAERVGATVFAVRPRFSELVAAAKIADTGERRANGSGKKAIVWKVVKCI